MKKSEPSQTHLANWNSPGAAKRIGSCRIEIHLTQDEDNK